MNFQDEPLWSQRDSDGIRTCMLDVGAVSTLRGRRKRRAESVNRDATGLWPTHWRDLVRDWVRQGGNRRTWDTLLKKAGGHRVHDAWLLLEELLKAGLVELEEVRKQGRWQPLWVDFTEVELLRELCGLTNRDTLRRIRAEQEIEPFHSAILAPLAASLAQMPVERAVRRHAILAALDIWISEGRSGTRRDFALVAAGDTKGLSPAEWDWLEEGVSGLEEVGISRHTPAVWLRAPLTLVSVKGKLDLRSVPDCIGITPETLKQVTGSDGCVNKWLIVENRTVFERLARGVADNSGVIWVPGFAPTWWKDAVIAVFRLCPAAACISCDPDPAGIQIALDIGRSLTENGFAWAPWHMDVTTLSSLPQKKRLTEDDRQRLEGLLTSKAPEILRELAEYMLATGEKGEQEGITYE